MNRLAAWIGLGLLVFPACGPAKRGARLEARDHFVAGRFAEAEKKILSPEVIEEGRNRLLTLMDLGMIAHASGDYSKSNLYFARARELAQKLFTSSVSQAVLTGFVNDNSADYPGMDYELSAIRYYLVLNDLLLSQAGREKAWSAPEIRDGSKLAFAAEAGPERALSPKERRELVTRARAEILEWDSFLNTVRERNRGEPYYKDDLLAKLVGAFVHQSVDRREDRQIAEGLLADARSLLTRSYGAYPTFNGSNKAYQENYRRFPELGEAAVESQYLSKTADYAKLESMIGTFREGLRAKPTLIVIEVGTVPEKKTRVNTIGLSSVMSGIEDKQTRQTVEVIGTYVILRMAPQIGVGLVAVAATGAVMGAVEDDPPDTISGAVDKAIGFEFELPAIGSVPTVGSYAVAFRPKVGGAETVVPLAFVNPYNDIARLNVERRATAVATKTGIRVGLKYLAALLPAILAYQKTPGPDFLRVAAAFAIYMAGKKIVDATEKADVRAWNTLPAQVTVGEAALPPGEYVATLIAAGGGVERRHAIGELRRAQDDLAPIFKARVFDPGLPVPAPVRKRLH